MAAHSRTLDQHTGYTCTTPIAALRGAAEQAGLESANRAGRKRLAIARALPGPRRGRAQTSAVDGLIRERAGLQIASEGQQQPVISGLLPDQ